MKDYDENNIFNKILNSEIGCEKIQENKNNLSFNDINKQAPIHVLTIPKKKYDNFNSYFLLSNFYLLEPLKKDIFYRND